MKRSEFIKLISSTFDEISLLNSTKGLEYAGDLDALSNFKEQAQALSLSPEQILIIYAGKHKAALDTHWYQLLGEIRKQKKSEPIEGRVNDLILYLILLKAIYKEYKEELL
jgi:hypothetical protein